MSPKLLVYTHTNNLDIFILLIETAILRCENPSFLSTSIQFKYIPVHSLLAPVSFPPFIFKYSVEPLFSPLQRYSICLLSFSYNVELFAIQPRFFYTIHENSYSTLQVSTIFILKSPTFDKYRYNLQSLLYHFYHFIFKFRIKPPFSPVQRYSICLPSFSYIHTLITWTFLYS